MENNTTGRWLLGTLLVIFIGTAVFMYAYSRPSKFPDIPGYQDYPSSGVFNSPARQFAQARNTQRSSNVNALLNAIRQNIEYDYGSFKCSNGSIPPIPTNLSSLPGGYNIEPCLVPQYLASMPFDPLKGNYTSPTNYDTGYTISRNRTTGKITVNAPYAELGAQISITQ